MGSSPNLDFGWVQVLARGFKSQSDLHGFSWWPRRDSDKVRNCWELGLGPRQAYGTPQARGIREDSPHMSAHFYQASQPRMLQGSDQEPRSGSEEWWQSAWFAIERWYGMAMLRHIQQQVQDRIVAAIFDNLYSSPWLWCFSPTFYVHCCSISFFLSSLNPRRPMSLPRCTFYWQELTLYFQLIARPTSTHHFFFYYSLLVFLKN